MIISCPECTGPFEIPAEHIAALVQIECPHCSFRMILDFAAANDPSLVEAGMRMASGFRSAADYHRFAGAPSVAEPAPRAPAARHLEPVPAQPAPAEPAAAQPVPARAPAASPAAAEPAAAEPVPARAPAASPASARPRSRAPAALRVPGQAVQVEPPEDRSVAAAREAAARTGGTVVGPAPVPPPGRSPEVEPALDVEEIESEIGTPTTEIETPAAEVQEARTRPAPSTPPAEPKTAEPEVRTPAPEPDEQRPAVDPTEAPGERIPPHTPPAPRAQTRSGDSELAVPDPAETSGTDLEVFEKQLHGSRFGTFVLVLLLLVAGGLVGASIALQGTPDPRPLLEDLYRQAFGK